MFAELIQLIFTLIFSLAGFVIAVNYGDFLAATYPTAIGYAFMILLFAGIGFLTGGYLAKVLSEATKKLDKLLANVPGIDLIIGVIGLLVGLVIALIVSLPFLNTSFGRVFSLICFFVFGFIGLFLSILKSREISSLVIKDNPIYSGKKVVDTSAIIDGRLSKMLQTGFMEGKLIIYGEVLKELQALADSNDLKRRKRGKRGLINLEELISIGGSSIEVNENSLLNGSSVDEKLVSAAKNENASLITTDSNLEHVAKAVGVKVLNINELQNVLRIPVQPGETIEVKIVRKGKEKNQGIGYLSDGTMVVVEDGEDRIGDTIDIVVTNVTQSSTGKIIFARLKG